MGFAKPRSFYCWEKDFRTAPVFPRRRGSKCRSALARRVPNLAIKRRVAVIAAVTDAQKQPRLRVAVTHFDTRAPVLQGWIFGGPAARNNQAKEFVSVLKKFQSDSLPLVVGGDLNTYLGSKSVI